MHLGIIQDMMQREWNVEQYGIEKICSRCNGTGNELYSMFRCCIQCDGTGVLREFVDPEKKLPTGGELLEMFKADSD